MYAVVGKWLMDPAQREEQDQALHAELVPMVKGTPGFVSGYWCRSVDGPDAVTFIVFEDRAAADGFADLVRSDPEDRGQSGVEPGWLVATEIAASA